MPWASTGTSCGSRARRRASERRWPAPAPGPTPRSSASRDASTPTSRRSPSTSPTWTRGMQSVSTSRRGSRRSGGSAPCSSTTPCTTGGAGSWVRGTTRTIASSSSPTRRRGSRSATCSSRGRAGGGRGRRRRFGADVVGVGAGRVPRLRDLRRVEGGDRAVGAVRARRAGAPGKGPWVVAIRPGFVDTPAARREAELPPIHTPAFRASPKRCGPGTCCRPTSRRV